LSRGARPFVDEVGGQCTRPPGKITGFVFGHEDGPGEPCPFRAAAALVSAIRRTNPPQRLGPGRGGTKALGVRPR